MHLLLKLLLLLLLLSLEWVQSGLGDNGRLGLLLEGLLKELLGEGALGGSPRHLVLRASLETWLEAGLRSTLVGLLAS
jgi:hypothetical protein